MEKKKVNRTRNHRLEIRFDNDEMEAIERNMKRAEIKTKSEYIRQIAVFGKVFKFDDTALKKCYFEINSIGRNFNQMTKIANQTGSIFKDDIEMLKDCYSNINRSLNVVFNQMEQIEKVVKNSKFETLSEQIKRIYSEK